MKRKANCVIVCHPPSQNKNMFLKLVSAYYCYIFLSKQWARWVTPTCYFLLLLLLQFSPRVFDVLQVTCQVSPHLLDMIIPFRWFDEWVECRVWRRWHTKSLSFPSVSVENDEIEWNEWSQERTNQHTNFTNLFYLFINAPIVSYLKWTDK